MNDPHCSSERAEGKKECFLLLNYLFILQLIFGGKIGGLFQNRKYAWEGFVVGFKKSLHGRFQPHCSSERAEGKKECFLLLSYLFILQLIFGGKIGGFFQNRK